MLVNYITSRHTPLQYNQANSHIPYMNRWLLTSWKMFNKKIQFFLASILKVQKLEWNKNIFKALEIFKHSPKVYRQMHKNKGAGFTLNVFNWVCDAPHIRVMLTQIRWSWEFGMHLHNVDSYFHAHQSLLCSFVIHVQAVAFPKYYFNFAYSFFFFPDILFKSFLF